METNDKSALVVGGMNVTTKTVFSISDEELKAFYLKEAMVLLPNRYVPNRTEYEGLCMLQDEYRRILAFFSQLNILPWEAGLSTLYSVTASFMMQNEHSVSDKKRVNASIAEHIEAVSILTTNRTMIHKLQGIYNTHYGNLSRLIKQYPEYTERKKAK